MGNAVIVASDTERLLQYCPDLENWPRSWSIEPRDIAPGQRIVSCFTPFLLHLLNLELSRKTLRVHRDNLWTLGGEIIRGLHEDPPLREHPIEKLLLSVIDEQGDRSSIRKPPSSNSVPLIPPADASTVSCITLKHRLTEREIHPQILQTSLSF